MCLARHMLSGSNMKIELMKHPCLLVQGVSPFRYTVYQQRCVYILSGERRRPSLFERQQRPGGLNLRPAGESQQQRQQHQQQQNTQSQSE